MNRAVLEADEAAEMTQHVEAAAAAKAGLLACLDRMAKAHGLPSPGKYKVSSLESGRVLLEAE